MFDDLRRADEIPAAELKSLPEEVLNSGRPTVLRGAVRDWPFVQAALRSDEEAVAYLLRFYKRQPVSVLTADPSEGGKLFYRPDSKQMNFKRSRLWLTDVLGALLEHRKSEHPVGIAAQAISAPDALPGLEEENPNRFVPAGNPARVWIGNAVTVSPHFDVADNIACVAAGRRRFFLFPPEQTANLYPGPMDVTPAGVPISMVSLDNPDLDRFPRYRDAIEAGFGAELEPGDAIHIPYLWWHGVKSLGSFNVLVNYWWDRDARTGLSPFAPLLRLAYVLYRDMPADQREAWRQLYDHYVFQTDGDPMAPFSRAHRDSEQRIDVMRLGNTLRDLLD
jgi:hypothetical protein